MILWPYLTKLAFNWQPGVMTQDCTPPAFAQWHRHGHQRVSESCRCRWSCNAQSHAGHNRHVCLCFLSAYTVWQQSFLSGFLDQCAASSSTQGATLMVTFVCLVAGCQGHCLSVIAQPRMRTCMQHSSRRLQLGHRLDRNHLAPPEHSFTLHAE